MSTFTRSEGFPPAPQLPPGWADKSDEVWRKKPVYRRDWFRRLVIALGLVIGLTGIVGGTLLWRWHREQLADLARQRRNVDALVRSPAFETFAREVDAQLVAAINFVVARPATARQLLPAIAAAEKARHEVPWPVELPPLPTSTADQPARVAAAVRRATDLLAQRGVKFDAAQTAEAHHVFLRLLAPHARAFLAKNPEATFPALFLDRHMQDIALTAFAARTGGTLPDTERAFVFFALVGPALWHALEGSPVQPGRQP